MDLIEMSNIPALERRIQAYLEMHPIMIVAALNVHQRTRAGFNQSKFFDRKALAEALHRSPLDTSEIFTHSTWYDGISWEAPFALTGDSFDLPNRGKIVHIEDDC
tara:strand:- start:795 stop:1109 length:315 start_codon:yes stop_codon:yes gene_type:complete